MTLTQTPPKAPTTAVDDARAAVIAARETLAEWEAKGAAAAVELTSMRDRAGNDILDNPDAEQSIARSMTELRDRIDLAERAVIAQRPRLLQAERRFLAAEADRREPELRELEEELAQHEKKTERLLAQIEAHEGPYLPESRLRSLQQSLRGVVEFEAEPTSWTIPKSAILRQRITAARRPVEVLRAMAVGEDPARLIAAWGVSQAEAYPSCVYGPEAVVPAGEYLRSIEHARTRVAELEDLQVRLPDEIRDWQQKQAEAGPSEVLLALPFREQRLAALPEELKQARAALAGLTGGAA